MSKLLVVVGATGSQGSAVLSYFQQHEPAYKLRGLTRDPSSEAATALANADVEIVKADLNDLTSLERAFEGASAIFGYTDFVGIVQSPAVMGRFLAGEITAPVGKAAFDIELQQGKNIADAAAGVPELERLVWSTLSHAKKWSRGKYTHGFHVDSKAEAAEYMFGLNELEGKVSTVQMGCFADNMAKRAEVFGFAKGSNGAITWTMPFNGDAAMPWIDVERDTGAFVKALLDAPGRTQILGVSESLSGKQWLSLWSKHTAVKASYQEMPFERFIVDDPTGFKLERAETFKYIEEFGYTGSDPDVVTPEELETRGFLIPRTKIIDYIKREDWSKLM